MTNVQRARTNGLREPERTDAAFTQPRNNQGQYFGVVLGEHSTKRMGQATRKAAVQRGDINPEDATFCWAALSRNSNEIG